MTEYKKAEGEEEQESIWDTVKEEKEARKKGSKKKPEKDRYKQRWEK